MEYIHFKLNSVKYSQNTFSAHFSVPSREKRGEARHMLTLTVYTHC